MMSYDLKKYATHALVSYGGMMVYDVLVDGKNVSDSFTMTDAGSFALSAVISDVAFDVLSGLVPFINEGSMTGYLAHPVIQAVVYSYLYEVMVDKKFPYYRTKTSAFYIGGIGSLLLNYLQNPILSLFGMHNIGY